MHRRPSTQTPTGFACLPPWDNGPFSVPFCQLHSHLHLRSLRVPSFLAPRTEGVSFSGQSPHLLLFTGILERGAGNSGLGVSPEQHTIPNPNTYQEGRAIHLPSSVPLHVSHSGPALSIQGDTPTRTRDLTHFLTTEDRIPRTHIPRKAPQMRSHTPRSQRGPASLQGTMDASRGLPPARFGLTHNHTTRFPLTHKHDGLSHSRLAHARAHTRAHTHTLSVDSFEDSWVPVTCRYCSRTKFNWVKCKFLIGSIHQFQNRLHGVLQVEGSSDQLSKTGVSTGRRWGRTFSEKKGKDCFRRRGNGRGSHADDASSSVGGRGPMRQTASLVPSRKFLTGQLKLHFG